MYDNSCIAYTFQRAPDLEVTFGRWAGDFSTKTNRKCCAVSIQLFVTLRIYFNVQWIFK